MAEIANGASESLFEIVAKAVCAARSAVDSSTGQVNPAAFSATKCQVSSAVLGLLIGSSGLKASTAEDAFRSIRALKGEPSDFEIDYSHLTPTQRAICSHVLTEREVYPVNWEALGRIYESTLGLSHDVTSGLITWKKEKSARNRQGSYYTPPVLAKSLVELTVKEYVYLHTGVRLRADSAASDWASAYECLATATVIDFSCGTGQFLLAYIDFVQDALNRSKLSAKPRHPIPAKNVYGFDVDYIAVEIARLSVAARLGNTRLTRQLVSNIVQANPLLTASAGILPEIRRRMFQEGDIYNASLGLDASPDRPDTYDIALGNPPWERLRLEDESVFRSFAPGVSQRFKKDEREKTIESLKKTNKPFYSYYTRLKASYETARDNITKDARFKNSAVGELNTYSLFTELAVKSVKPDSAIGLLVKSGIATTAVNRRLFAYLVESRKLVAFVDFVNNKRLFPIDSRERYAFLVLAPNPESTFAYASGVLSPEELDDGRVMHVRFDVLQKLNPETKLLPSLRDDKHLELLLKIYGRNSLFASEYPQALFGRLVHFTTHAADIVRRPARSNIPVYEGKFIEQFDGRFATFAGLSDEQKYASKASARKLTEAEKADGSIMPVARFFIDSARWKQINKRYRGQYSLMWRSLTSASNRRTTIATILPHQPTSQSIQFLQLEDEASLATLVALFNSTTFDFLVRSKLNGIDLTQPIVRQVAVPWKSSLQRPVNFVSSTRSLQDHLIDRVVAIYAGDRRLAAFCNDRVRLALSDRSLLIDQLDALVAMAYGLSNAEYEIILSSMKENMDRVSLLDSARRAA